MAAKKQSNLTLTKVKQVSKQMNETEVHIIEEGVYAGEQITFSPIFNDKAIEELLTEFSQLYKEAEDKEIELTKNNQIYLIYLLTIKHFTHFKNSLNFPLLGEDGKGGMLNALDQFHKTGLLSECVNNMFLPSETAKVLNKLTDFAAMGLLATDLDKKMVEKFENLKLKNRDVFEQLGKQTQVK